MRRNNGLIGEETETRGDESARDNVFPEDGPCDPNGDDGAEDPMAGIPITFQREKCTDEFIRECSPLWAKHQDEFRSYEGMELGPDISIFKAGEAGGILRIFSVRKRGFLVGYNVFIVAMDPHFKGDKIANQDLIFIERDERKGMLGYRFMKWCDQQLKDEGVKFIFQRLNVQRNHGAILLRMGYEPIDMVYRRRIF